MVYVDDMRAPFRRMIMCHMIADSQKELLEMAKKIGMAERWLQNKDTYLEHFDICLSKRALAISMGAVEITWRQLGEMCINRKKQQQ